MQRDHKDFLTNLKPKKMKKINKLFANWNLFTGVTSFYITTFQNEVKRALKCDDEGFFFILNKEKERINSPIDIERIEQFLNIK